ncbi:GRAS family protein [Paenibacillus sp.]|uniref:GRAS family protein n=1 Tax=Paenibacillus sp. TaxID=58172 RepID=UPI002D23810A|nr:GRAS family protein [Paenibacillus sp.]HZG88047.1 GRAS family protein [Paenibacillus sp.]
MRTYQTESYATLRSLLDAALNGGGAEVRERLARFAGELKVAERPDDLLPYLFAAATMKRLDPQENEQMNLYLRQYDVPQIVLFNVLARKVPFVTCVTEIANEALTRRIACGEAAALLEIGIGTGRQIVALLRELDRQGRRPSLLTVYAVEPNETFLEQAGKQVLEAADRCGIPVQFVPVPSVIEEMPEAIWERIGRTREALLVNAAFALHHVRGSEGESDAKDAVLRRIFSLAPRIVTLSEPDTDHQTPNNLLRFDHSWHHFSSVFQLLDTLEMTPEENRAVKIFFAREIEDIIASPEHLRCERHERTEDWIARLRKAGFAASPELAAVPVPGLAGVTFHRGEWHIGLATAGGVNLTSMICAETP